MARRPARSAAAALLLVLALGGPIACGDDGDDGSEEAPREVVRTDPRPALPAGWKRVVNARAGYNLGLPPGWTARRVGQTDRLTSFDRALAGSVAADRSEQGLALTPGAYARAATRGLRGFEGLKVAPPQRVSGTRYPTARVRARGTLRAGRLRQEIAVYALKPPRGATYSFVFFRSARVPAARYAALVEAIVRTLRVQERVP